VHCILAACFLLVDAQQLGGLISRRREHFVKHSLIADAEKTAQQFIASTATQLLLHVEELHEEILVDRVHQTIFGLLLWHHFHQLFVVDHRNGRRFVIRNVRSAVVDAIAVGVAILHACTAEAIHAESVRVLLAMTQHAVLQCEFAKAHVAVERSFATRNESYKLVPFSYRE